MVGVDTRRDAGDYLMAALSLPSGAMRINTGGYLCCAGFP